MTVEPVAQPTVKELTERRWPPPQGEWTYNDYARLPDHGLRYEVIEGELYMAAAPRSKHQKVIFALAGHFWDHLQHHPVGEAYTAPIDVILPAGLGSPVQPDLLFIANERLGIVKDTFIEGAPDLIVEVLSPGNPMLDRRTKFTIYARAGVREYWIVDPDGRTIDVYVLRGQAYALLGGFGPGDQAISEVLVGFAVSVSEICPA